MSIVDFKKLLISTLVLLSIPLLGLAQDSEGDSDDADAEDQAKAKAIEEIVVTGSRLKRDTYSSIAPLQIITGQMSREVGLIDPATILQESTAAAGAQVDLTWQGFVLDNGPGATNIDLRGLGIGRTLVLIDGRRAAPAGVEGAPYAADLSLIPASLVQQYDVLLDGASSIYGSDAVAGVTNIILRKDFDGLELEAYVRSPDQSGGMQNTISLAYGKNFDRGFFGVGIEYEDNEKVTLDQRRWTANCTQHVEVDENGLIRNTDLWYQQNFDMRASDCTASSLAGRIQLDDLRAYTGSFDPGPGSVYYTPGFSNTGIPNFSDANNAFLSGGLDGNGDGMQDIHYFDYALDSLEGQAHLYPEFERLSAMAYGEYTLEGEMNLTPFFELQYNKRTVFADSGHYQFFPWVPPSNAYNICNPNGVDGMDCAVAWNDHYAQQTVIDRFIDTYGDTPQNMGLGVNTPVGGMWVRPIVRVVGDRTQTDVEVYQTRFVAGLRGDLPNFTPGPLQDWSFELTLVTAVSKGKSSRVGIREDWLDDSIYTSVVDPVSGNVVCGEDTTGDGIPDGVNADGRTCVPVNLWAPSLYEGIVGDLATQAERDYLFDSRDFNTDYEQTIWSAFMSGDVFQMPAGPVLGVVGFEYRDDSIDSMPDEVARDGLFFGFFADGGAVGEKFTREYYAEMEFPLLANVTAAKELNFNISGRHTTDEYYGSGTTYSLKLGWRPIDSLLLRATKGTSFRAPNLRENFLLGQTGFNNSLFDPCGIPDDALDPITGYNPALDTREAHVLQNCMDNGVDPTTTDFGGFNVYSAEVSTGGATDIIEETSDSTSYGFVWDQPFFEAFGLTFGWTFYEIDVSNSIIEPTSQFIVNDCYNAVNLNSVFCSRITRGPDQRIDFINSGFINRDQLLVSGYDINLAYDQSVTMFSRPIDLSLDLILNHPKEASETFLDNDGNPDFDDSAGEWGYPDWRGTMSFRVDFSDYRITWQTRYISDIEQDPDGIDDFDDVTGIADTCLGPSQGDVLCRDVGFADDYYMHSVSMYYYGDVWTIGGGIRNVFDEEPPQVDGSEVFSIRNTPIGVGYDLNGMTYFLNIAARFQ